MKTFTSAKLRQVVRLSRRFFYKRKLQRSLAAERANKEKVLKQLNSYEFYIEAKGMSPRAAYETTFRFYKEDEERRKKAARRELDRLADLD